MPKLSIIIAMYNIEEYIAHCINSCINQVEVSSDDYEIIVVNDGSTDRSPEIASTAILGVKNARMITRANGGLSAARNTGIEEARGEYLWFVDGDDAISYNALKVLLTKIELSQPDALLINFSTFNSVKKLETSNFKCSNEVLSGKEYHFTLNRILPQMAWLTIYRADVLKQHEIFFMPNVIHEDFEFSIRAHHVSTSIVFINDDLYMYRVGRSGSIMSESRKDNTKSLISQIVITNSFKKFFEGFDNGFVRKLYAICAVSTMITYYHPSSINNDITESIFNGNKRAIYIDLWNSRHWKFRCFLGLLLIFPKKIISKVIPMIDKNSKLM